jgi:hypothetical protein
MTRRFITLPEWVEESMFTPVRRGDPVFKLDPRGARTNRSLFVSHDPEYVCAQGYRLSARLAVEHIRQDGIDSLYLVYPVVFLYRHHIELMLKRLIMKADQSGVRYGTNREELSEDIRRQILKRHSLQWLWDQFRPAVEALGSDVVPTEEIKAINSYIQQLNEIDPNSEDFRYTRAIEETKAKLDEVQEHGGALGIQNFASAMERLAYCLEGFDGYFDSMIDGYHEMLADSYDPSY